MRKVGSFMAYFPIFFPLAVAFVFGGIIQKKEEGNWRKAAAYWRECTNRKRKKRERE